MMFLEDAARLPFAAEKTWSRVIPARGSVSIICGETITFLRSGLLYAKLN